MRERKAAERGKQEVKKKENEWEKKSRQKKGRKAGGNGRKKLEEDKTRWVKKEMQVEGKRKGRKEKSDRKKHLLGIEPMPGLKV